MTDTGQVARFRPVPSDLFFSWHRSALGASRLT